MLVRLLFFARARELAGSGETQLEVSAGSSAAEVLNIVLQKWPALQEIAGRCVMAVNQEYLEDTTMKINEGDEIALLPPVSGG